MHKHMYHHVMMSEVRHHPQNREWNHFADLIEAKIIFSNLLISLKHTVPLVSGVSQRCTFAQCVPGH